MFFFFLLGRSWGQSNSRKNQGADLLLVLLFLSFSLSSSLLSSPRRFRSSLVLFSPTTATTHPPLARFISFSLGLLHSKHGFLSAFFASHHCEWSLIWDDVYARLISFCFKRFFDYGERCVSKWWIELRRKGLVGVFCTETAVLLEESQLWFNATVNIDQLWYLKVKISIVVFTVQSLLLKQKILWFAHMTVFL